jgi:hypothetical protein
MTARRVTLLFAMGIAVLVLAVWMSGRSQSARDSIVGSKVLPGLESSVNDVTQIRITKADRTQTTLERKATEWIVAERDYPADSGKLRKLLLDLGSLQAVERKTALPRNYPVLGVQDVTRPNATGARIDVVSAHKTWSLIVGNSMDDNDCYVRVVATAQSLLASPLIMVDADPKLWLDPNVLDIAQNRISEVDEQPVKAPAFGVSRDKSTQADFAVHGVPRGRELSGADAADTMGSALSALTLTDAIKAGAPGNGSLSHAVFKTFDGLEIDISGYQQAGNDYIEVSARGADKSAAATEAQRINSRVQGWDYAVPDYRYEEIFQSLDGLLKPLPVKKPSVKAHGKPRG